MYNLIYSYTFDVKPYHSKGNNVVMGSKLRWYLFNVISRLQLSLIPTLKAERERQEEQLCSECKRLFRNMVSKGDWESSFKVDLENSWRCSLCPLILHQLAEQTLRKLHDVQARYAYFEGRGYETLLWLGYIQTTFSFRWIGRSGYIEEEEEVVLHWIPGGSWIASTVEHFADTLQK